MISWNAPAPSPAPPPWTPVPLPDERRGDVLVTGALRGVLHPRRGGIAVPVRPLAGLDEAWAGLRHHVWSVDRMMTTEKAESSRVWGYVTSTARDDRVLGERLLDPAARVGGADDDHALVRAVRNRFTWYGGPQDDWLADFLTAAHGLPEAARRIIGGFDSDLPYSGVGVFGRLRQLLVLADDAGYAAARDAILDARDRQAKQLDGSRLADLFWAVSFLLPVGPASGPEERDAHDAALRNVGEFGNCDVHACGLAAGDAATVERFLEANPRVRHEFFSQSGGRLYLASLLEFAGAGPILARMRPDWPFHDHAHYNAVWTALLGHVDHESAREILGADHVPGAGIRAEEDDRSVPPGAPFAYRPPEAAHPVSPEPSVPVAPVLDWREHERAAAEALGVHADAAQWDGVPIGDCDTAAVTAWLEHHEHWAIPAPFTALALAPRWTHDRLMALGFAQHSYWVRWVLPLVLLRHGASHVPALVAAFDDRSSVEAALAAAQPIGHAALAGPIARAFAVRKHRRPARAWLLRHPRHAAAGIVAEWIADRADPVLGRALRWLDAQGHRALLLAQASSARDDLLALLELDPLAAPRAKQPRIPTYLTRTPLPGIPEDDQKLLLVRLAACDADQVHPGVLAARARFTAGDRAAFTDALLDRWLAAGTPSTEAWCLHATGLLGDDTGARRLAALARQWAGANAAARAQTALDAIRHRGTDAALTELNLLAERSRFPAFASVARGHIEEIAALRGLSTDELADRMVPALGAEADLGGYRLAFDHRLLPVVRDESGRVLADLPRKAEFKQARAELAAIRRAARASASLHVARLERAMCTGRRIPAAIFVDRFAVHPWMTHLAQRLVWGVFDGGTLTESVRVAEDGTFATAGDDPFALPPSSTVGVLHPVEFRPERWAGVFADYQLLQPFPQLDRPYYTDASALSRFAGRTVSYPVLRGLERHGWTRWYDASMVQMAKPLPGGGHAMLDTTPGWHASDTVDSAPEQTVRRVVLAGDVPPVALSELVHDLRVLG
ncbi:hypothetical protein J2S43_001959 [Catenuloplanes nepalensis]|uniref:DUF4132 domain-containing protein n=1 Tax=Catenuloplanes nepalensis TaxID=587533 RepID=A0ABT9MPV3_9ACTN|nr:DUF4132 domain-containing protein [Catenuloplanes nepalensis]MDP9793447.1 hypothetical protein [Catenuloplanes nepalensis]